MKRSVFIALLFVSQLLFSQKVGFQIKINLKEINEEKLYLSYYNGSISKTATVDSVVIAGKNEAVFTQKKKIVGALYRLSFKRNDKLNFVNVNLENGANLVFNLHNTVLRSITTTDPLNKAVLLAQNVINRDQRETNLKAIVQDFPLSAAALYAKLELKEFAILKEEIQLKDFRNQFFKNIDLNDKRIKLLPNIYSSLFTYMKILPITNENYKSNVDVLLKGQTCKSRNYLLYLKWIFMNLDYLNKYELDQTYNYVFNTYLNSVDCMNADGKFYQSILLKLRQNEKLPLGSVISDVAMTDIDGADTSLSLIYPEHDYTLVIFYDPDCVHCQEKMPEIQKFFSENNFTKDVKILAFLNTINYQQWKKFVEDYKMQSWQNVKSKNNSAKYQEELGVFSNPNYVLLNRKGEVVLKNFNTDEFKKLFN